MIRDVVEVRSRRGATPRGRRVVLAAVTLVLVVGWVWLSTPRLIDGGINGVRSVDRPILSFEDDDISGRARTVHVVPADGGESTMTFAVRNEGLLPLRLESAFAEDPGDCFWRPRLQRVRTDPASLGSATSPTSPLAGTVVQSGEIAQVSLTGGLPAGRECSVGVLTYYTGVTLDVSVAGRRSAVQFPLDYALAWQDGPLNEVIVDPSDVATTPPMPDLVP